MGGKTTPSRSFSQLQRFLSLITYISGPYNADKGYKKLEQAILYQEKLRAGKNGQTGRIFYLALPPSIYLQVSRNIKEHCMNVCGWNRIVIEKPFGKDLASSNQLNGQLGKLFAEEEIYRIDHYLGKEAVQNLLVLRFANHIFQPLWNRDHIDNVQIVFKEDFGTEGRGGYFDEYGIVRDIIQNHLIQVLCLMAMEKPASLSPECIRDEKLKVLKSMKPINHEEVVLGQYNGYLDDSTVPKDSNTPTFASVILRIHNERWDGVPFIIKAGKALDSRKAEIRVQFKDVAGDIYRSQRQGRNEFVIRLQPSEAMYMKFTVKKPGLDMSTTQSEMDLSFLQRYEGVIIPEAYERLFLDIVRGDQQHFVRRDELEAAWQIFTPLLHAIEKGEFTSVIYPQGSRGPPEADQLAERAGYVQTHGYIWIPPSLMSRV
ncbi:hypothetical protein L7F22_006050 [Adiantum nelumboides]|nr:hypothetical protein [Adiantum nelumboides]